jgi:hypothetical protein
MKILSAAILSLLFLSACADDLPPPATPGADTFNQPQPTIYGQMTPTDIWQVRVSGQGQPVDKVQRMALWRAAQITLKEGFDSFAIIGGPGFDSRMGTMPSNAAVYENVTVQGTGANAITTRTPVIVPAQAVPTLLASGEIVIKTFRSTDAAPAERYDARQVMQMYSAEFGN